MTLICGQIKNVIGMMRYITNISQNSTISKEIVDEMETNDFPLEKKHFRNVHLFATIKNGI